MTSVLKYNPVVVKSFIMWNYLADTDMLNAFVDKFSYNRQFQ